MEISGTGVLEDRIAALEKRLREMEALVKGLLEELLDFRAVTMTMSRQIAEDSRQALKEGPIVRGITSPVLAGPSTSPSIAAPSDGSTVIRSGAHASRMSRSPQLSQQWPGSCSRTVR